MIKIGITGQSGFLGSHLYNTLSLDSDRYTCIPFEDSFFDQEEELNGFVVQCDVIVHLAAMNRHNDPNVLYETNVKLVQQIITACEETRAIPHILFSSSIHENLDNLFGKSKLYGRELFEKWARRNSGRFTGLIIPNVFGPFGHPYYNSVIATFCHQLSHNETPKIDVDGVIKLIYVSELVKEIIDIIELNDAPLNNVSINMSGSSAQDSRTRCETKYIAHTSEVKVSHLLKKLTSFKENYSENGTIPNLDNPFDLNLWNTFLCYNDHASLFPFNLKLNTDKRGSFVEIIKLNSGGQVSFSLTAPGVTRGNHFHTRKAERFAVINGKARIELRKIGTNVKISFMLDGDQPSFVDMPIWYTHNITNIGDKDLYTIFWINEFFDKNDPDTYFEEV